jgi:hypothetical protein
MSRFVWCSLLVFSLPVRAEPSTSSDYRIVRGKESYPLTVREMEMVLRADAQEKPELYKVIAPAWQNIADRQDRAEAWAFSLGAGSLGLFVASAMVPRSNRMQWGQAAIAMGGGALFSYWLLAPDSTDLLGFLEQYNDHARELSQPELEMEEGWYGTQVSEEIKQNLLTFQWNLSL